MTVSKRIAGNLIALVPLAFVGSVSASTAEDMSELVDAWIGQSEEDLLAVWGESLRMTAESGHTLHIYSARGRGGGGIRVSGGVNSFPVGGNRSNRSPADDIDGTMRELGGCDVTFEINSGIVVDASWSTEGSPERDKARRTCWREFRRNEAG